MEDVTPARDSAGRALASFESVFAEPFTVILRDAAIQRFEFTFEAVWKYLKAHLAVHEGMICMSPKGCFRDAFRVGLMDEETTVTALEMVDDRNRIVHTYHEAIATEIWNKLPQYRDVMRSLFDRMGERELPVAR